ncbi:MAG: Abortive infection protein [Phycisphaerales bacterium]|nr:Abortive infection protein [Phycisphaerales bacterium]
MTRAAVAGNGGESILLTPPGYLRRATLPLPSLVLLLPMVVMYEVGTRYLTTAARHGHDQQIIAFSKLQEFFHLFGATGRHLPALAVVAILLAWHIARNDTWQVELATVIGMVAESIMLSLPVLLLGFAINRYLTLAGVSPAPGSAITSVADGVRDRLIMDLGAGIYEEFLFRLVLFTLFSMIFKDLLKLQTGLVYLLMVVISGVLFSAYHYWNPTERLVWRIFAFRALAGIYFGIIFLFRGFGITAASHTFYDIIVTLL